MIRQQISATKTFDDAVQRITVLIRAADLLWPHQQDRARAALSEAFELAEQNFREKGDEPKLVNRVLVEIPDQRYIVIRIIAKRDPARAKKLTDGILKREQEDSETATRTNPEKEIRTAEKLLDSATYLLASDTNAALNFATASLRYPTSLTLTRFLYRFAEVNQRAADRLYEQALAVYGDKPMREFLYLAAYPFGGDDAGDMPSFGQYAVPDKFVPNVSLQRLFTSRLLSRAKLALQIPLDDGDNYNGFPGIGHILQVLTSIEPQVKTGLPDLGGPVEEARHQLLASLSQEHQTNFLQSTRAHELATAKTFDEQIEAAEKETNVNERDKHLVFALLNARKTESVHHVVETVDKIADSKTRSQFLDWFYFGRAQSAIKAKRLDEATELASKVQEIDQRAYLFSEIAKIFLQNVESENHARERLEDIVATATKGPNTVTSARALLAAAYLYLKIDPSRSISILEDVVKLINRIDSPDFSAQFVLRNIEGRYFVIRASLKTPGFSPEAVFREVARVDFDNALAQVSGLTDKGLRSQTTLVLADFCLQRANEREKVETGKKKAKP